MTPIPKISVVMSTFNHQKYIRVAVESILKQNLADLELWVVNDGSSDDTWEILQSISDPRLHCLNQKNQGPSVALNAGIRQARGQYLALMSGDDIAEPPRLSRQLEEYQKLGQGVLFSHVSFIDDDGQKIAAPKGMQSLFNGPDLNQAQVLKKLLQTGNFLNAVTMFSERKLLLELKPGQGPFHPLLMALQDYELWLELSKRHPIKILTEPLVRYRLRADDGNLSAPSKPNLNRLHTEYYLVNRQFFQGISDGLFAEAFGPPIADRATAETNLFLQSPFPYCRLLGIERLYLATTDGVQFGKTLQAGPVFSAETSQGPKLYVDNGRGFEETSALIAPQAMEEGRFEMTYDLTNFTAVRSLRWDPIENSFCRVRLTQVKLDEQLLSLQGLTHNGIKNGDDIDFCTGDPIFLIPVDFSPGRVTLSGVWKKLSLYDVEQEYRLVAKKAAGSFAMGLLRFARKDGAPP